MLPARNGRIYLDHNATSPLLDRARRAMARALEEPWGASGNASSPHAYGHEARLALEQARSDVASLIGAKPREVVFVSGGTEADNLAVQGAARAADSPGHLITCAVEHPAVLAPCRYLESAGWRVTVLPVDGQGVVDPDDVRTALSPDTRLVSIMAANNETGVLQPLEAIGSLAREAGVPMHVDAVQAAGRVPVNVRQAAVDYLSISSHKMGGPIGIGALFVREGAPLAPLILGGGQEGKRRAGTEAPALAAGFAAAAAAARDGACGPPAGLRDRMEEMIRERLGGLCRVRINGLGAPRLPNTSSLTFEGIDAEALVIRMDLAGFAISTGSACSTGSSRPSHVLAAMGLGSEGIASTVRISLGPANTREEIDALVAALEAALADLAGDRGGRRIASGVTA